MTLQEDPQEVHRINGQSHDWNNQCARFADVDFQADQTAAEMTQREAEQQLQNHGKICVGGKERRSVTTTEFH